MRAGSVLRERGRERAEAAVRRAGGGGGTGWELRQAGRAGGPGVWGFPQSRPGSGLSAPRGPRVQAAGSGRCSIFPVSDGTEEAGARCSCPGGDPALKGSRSCGGFISPTRPDACREGAGRSQPGLSGAGHSRTHGRVPLTVGERFSR